MTRSRTRNAMTVVTAKAAEDVPAEQTQSLRLLTATQRHTSLACKGRRQQQCGVSRARAWMGTFANTSE